MKSWSKMSHGEKADFLGEVAAASALLSLAFAILAIVLTVISIISG
jgi:hypothetical protein